MATVRKTGPVNSIKPGPTRARRRAEVLSEDRVRGRKVTNPLGRKHRRGALGAAATGLRRREGRTPTSTSRLDGHRLPHEPFTAT